MAEARTSSPRLLHEFFEETARLHPSVMAIDVPPGPGRPTRQQRSYQELQREVESLAARISEVAAARDVVGILLPRTTHHLYAAQLAALRSGCAFTCIDPAFPDAHIEAVMQDAAASLLLTDQQGLERIRSSRLLKARTPQVIDVSRQQVARAGPCTAREIDSTDLAYIIYTSGTTGTPKGVMIEHRSVVNLVASDLPEFALGPGDRVGQGSSAAYDSSIEEIWLALASGATLVVMDDQTSRMGPDLVPWLRRERITVFCPPPTLLRTTGCTNPHEALPDLRLLYVGGEALTDDLVERWARGRRLVNGYGPTECTVTVVRGDVVPGEAVTIGKAVPGNETLVLDAQLNPVPRGEAGELCIKGLGLARGYRNQPELTAQKFPHIEPFGRIYRTGDLVQEDAHGNLLYLGRIDAQVKLRGYRIELEAIEACVAACEGVREAACRVQGEGTQAMLVAYLVPVDPAAAPFESDIKQALRQTLPHYMVPAQIGVLESLPRTVGGKLDRKRLPTLETAAPDSAREIVAPQSPIEAAIVRAFVSALGRKNPVSTQEDFFRDLGGDSISVVGVICALREEPGFPGVTTRDLYETRTAAALAKRLAAQTTRGTLTKPSRPIDADAKVRPILVTLLQAAWIIVGLLIAGASGYAAVFLMVPALIERFGVVGALLLEVPVAMLAIAGYTFAMVSLTLALKLALIGQYVPMRTPVWSMLYLRHWIVQSASRLIPWGILAGTPLCSVVLRLLGATVGHRVHFHRGVNLQDGGWDLLTIGDDVTIDRDVHLGLVSLEAGCLSIGPVHVGAASTLETRANISAGASLAPGAMLTALSWLPDGVRVPEGERWNGVPARPAGAAPAAPNVTCGRGMSPGLYGLVHLLVEGVVRTGSAIPLLLLLGALTVFWNVPAEWVLRWLSSPTFNATEIGWTLAGAVLWVPLTLLLKAMLLRAMGRVTPGVMPRWSLAYIRVWQKAAMLESAGLWLTGTLYWPIWLRLAGMKIGRDCEISTITDVVPETISIGGGSFFADGIYLGGPDIHRGTVTVSHTTLSRGTFLGNHVIIPAGSQLPEDLFIGVCTVAPGPEAAPGTAWFGHPALQLPGREVIAVDRHLTHSPGFARVCSRLFWETLRFTLPIIPIAAASLWLWAIDAW
ncbi:MAG: amino acid adenylation domain-containing protein, partial [Planctomycetota bacterium]|nr:amino acid adenylation domain-containing protein [Planctomycetota bacterium]